MKYAIYSTIFLIVVISIGIANIMQVQYRETQEIYPLDISSAQQYPIQQGDHYSQSMSLLDQLTGLELLVDQAENNLGSITIDILINNIVASKVDITPELITNNKLLTIDLPKPIGAPDDTLTLNIQTSPNSEQQFFLYTYPHSTSTNHLISPLKQNQDISDQQLSIRPLYMTIKNPQTHQYTPLRLSLQQLIHTHLNQRPNWTKSILVWSGLNFVILLCGTIYILLKTWQVQVPDLYLTLLLIVLGYVFL